jgi:molecular chaperone GrpE
MDPDPRSPFSPFTSQSAPGGTAQAGVAVQPSTVSDHVQSLDSAGSAEASASVAPVNPPASTQQVLAEILALRQDFETKLLYDATKERQVEALHRELQAHKQGIQSSLLRPIFHDLIAMHDDLGKHIEHAASSDPSGAAGSVAQNLASFQQTVEETLRRNGVETFTLPGSVFNGERQRSLQTIDTADPTLDRQVARRIRKGFEYEGRVLRPELVATYRHTAAR